jgi:hypothetical protein
MESAPAIDLTRSRDLGALFGDTFSLYRRYFALFAGIAFAVVIPMGPWGTRFAPPCGAFPPWQRHWCSAACAR